MRCGRVIEFFILAIILSASRGENEEDAPYQINIPEVEDIFDGSVRTPSVAISVLVRNKYHTLPYFLTCLYNLNYPKDKIYIWIHSDFNQDDSDEVLEKWVDNHAHEYNGLKLTTNKTSGHLHPDEDTPTQWTRDHYEHVIEYRERALRLARNLWADYIFLLDADAFLTERNTLKYLVEKNQQIVAPMLLSDTTYSNFWTGRKGSSIYFEESPQYRHIQSRSTLGCFQVTNVHTALLVSLKLSISNLLSYRPLPRYTGHIDDVTVFGFAAGEIGFGTNICNDHIYGFTLVPLEEGRDYRDEFDRLLNVKLEAIGRHRPLPLAEELEEFVQYPEPWRYGVGLAYMINLDRRPERRRLMEKAFREMGMIVKRVEAVDGRELDMFDLSRHGISLMKVYQDPYHKRPMKAGEVGCFLSHYTIWREIVEKGLPNALVLEDDVHFVSDFRKRLPALLDEVKHLDWDLLYLGRKILLDKEEQYVTAHTTRPLYSYWTLGYVVTLRGARKLLDAKPLAKMLPVDEFLPIMFDQHPNTTWKSYFPTRDLVALSAAPLLLHPTHYTGQDGYVSDTEDSHVVYPAAPPPRNMPAHIDL